jgi:hypothetical protein
MAIDQNSPDRISGVPVVPQEKETSSIMSFPENRKLHNMRLLFKIRGAGVPSMELNGS